MFLINLSKLSVWIVYEITFRNRKNLRFLHARKSLIFDGTQKIKDFLMFAKLKVLQPEKFSIFPCPKHKACENRRFSLRQN